MARSPCRIQNSFTIVVSFAQKRGYSNVDYGITGRRRLIGFHPLRPPCSSTQLAWVGTEVRGTCLNSMEAPGAYKLLYREFNIGDDLENWTYTSLELNGFAVTKCVMIMHKVSKLSVNDVVMLDFCKWNFSFPFENVMFISMLVKIDRSQESALNICF